MSRTIERKIQCYPSPKYNTLIRAYAVVNEISESAAASLAIKCFIESLPEDQKIKIINAGKQLNGSKNSY